MKRALPPISESVEQLEQLLKSESHSRRREHIQMLYLLKSHQAFSRQGVAKLLAVRRWLDRYAQDGLYAMLRMDSGAIIRYPCPPPC